MDVQGCYKYEEKFATMFNQDKEAKSGPTAANYAQMQVKDVNATY